MQRLLACGCGLNEHDQDCGLNEHDQDCGLNEHDQDCGINEHDQDCGINEHDQDCGINEHDQDCGLNEHDQDCGMNEHDQDCGTNECDQVIEPKTRAVAYCCRSALAAATRFVQNSRACKCHCKTDCRSSCIRNVCVDPFDAFVHPVEKELRRSLTDTSVSPDSDSTYHGAVDAKRNVFSTSAIGSDQKPTGLIDLQARCQDADPFGHAQGMVCTTLPL